MNKFFLQGKAEFGIDSESNLDGKTTGVVYSGGPIKQHGPFENLIIDLSTTTIAKKKTPLFKNHIPSDIAGHGLLSIKDNQLILEEGQLSKKTASGIEIRELAEEGFEWEMSMGVFDFVIQEIENEEVNGHLIEKGFVFRNGVIREASFVPLGADINTTANVFNYSPKGEKVMENLSFTKDEWSSFACSCGGNKDATKEDVKKVFEENEKKIKELSEQNEALKEQFAASEKIIEEGKAVLRVEQLKEAFKAKKITVDSAKIEESAKTLESTEALLSLLQVMTVEKTIAAEFSVEDDIGSGTEEEVQNEKTLLLKAEAMVKSGEAQTIIEALEKIK